MLWILHEVNKDKIQRNQELQISSENNTKEKQWQGSDGSQDKVNSCGMTIFHFFQNDTQLHRQYDNPFYVINFKLECESEAINHRSHMLCKLTFQSHRDGISLLHTIIARQVSDEWSWPCGPKASRRGFKGKGTQWWETLDNRWEGIKFSESRKCLPSVWYQKRWSTVKNWEKKLETNPCFRDSRGSLPVISANE